jgi:5'-phosphate synthase pdxT subunit
MWIFRYDVFCMIVGVLAFQGDFAEHIAVLHSLSVPAIEVRSLADLSKVSALIIPGGESTVIAKFLEESGVGKEISRRVGNKGGKVGMVGKLGSAEKNNGSGILPVCSSHSLIVYGTCAGAIILARKVTGKNAPRSLGLIDITIDRNAYGTQVDSFEAELKISGIKKPVPVAFIRAPKITRVGKGVEVLALHDGDPVLVRQGRVLVSTFHPEVRGDTRIHELFLRITRD